MPLVWNHWDTVDAVWESPRDSGKSILGFNDELRGADADTTDFLLGELVEGHKELSVVVILWDAAKYNKILVGYI